MQLFHLQGCISPLCDLLTVMDAKIVQVALNGIQNILQLGEQEAKTTFGVNPYAVLVEECYGKIDFIVADHYITYVCSFTKCYDTTLLLPVR